MVTLSQFGLDRLSIEDRIELVNQLEESIGADTEASPLTDAQRDELIRRWDDDEANPNDSIPWEEVRAKSLKRLGL